MEIHKKIVRQLIWTNFGKSLQETEVEAVAVASPAELKKRADALCQYLTARESRT